MKYYIGEMADLFNNTTGAIRFYEENNLVNPERDESGNRVYSTFDFLKLFYLKRYQKVGFTIRETQQFFSSSNTNPLSKITSIVDHKKEEIKEEIEKLHYVLEWLTNYETDLAKAINQDESISHSKMEELLVFDVDQMDLSNKKTKKTFKQIISLIPLSNVYIKTGEQQHKTFCISLPKRIADQFKIEVSQSYELIKSSHVANMIISKDGENFKIDVTDELLVMKRELLKESVEIVDSSFTLLYSHVEHDKEVKYYNLSVYYNKNS